MIGIEAIRIIRYTSLYGFGNAMSGRRSRQPQPVRMRNALLIIFLIEIILTHIGKANRVKGCFKSYDADS
jgi:hypothetical protein